MRDAAAGSATVHLVPSDAGTGMNYLFAVGIGTSHFFVQLRGDGTMTSQNTDASAVSVGAVQLANTTVSVIDRGAYNQQWTIRQVAAGTLNASVVHVPGITYLFEANAVSKTYSVAQPCAIAPPTLDMGGYLFEFNCGAIDTDGDVLGDACDPDDDGDGVPDTTDNCPQIPNANQADSNGNGVGDACDGNGDDDGDGVMNSLDRCPLSPAGIRVDGTGCTGPQRINLRCQRAQFVNHGQYVSCVAQAGNDAVAEGLITAQQRALIVREAARLK